MRARVYVVVRQGKGTVQHDRGRQSSGHMMAADFIRFVVASA